MMKGIVNLSAIMNRAFITLLGAFILVMAITTQSKAEKEAPPTTAEETVKAMVTSVMKQDIESAKSFMDQEWISTLEFIFQKKGGVKGFWAKLTNDFTAESLEFRASESNNDVTKVPVTLTLQDKTTMSSTFRCKKRMIDGLSWATRG